jgi:predicted nucleotidyltransferase
MTVSIESRILTALLYADIFDYPLTVRELVQWIPSQKAISPRVIHTKIQKLIKEHRIGYTPPFLYVSGHKKIIQLRIERLAASTDKLKKIRNTVKILRHIPTVMMIGVTGGLAVNNADNQDDIDLFVVTKRKTLWTTRFLVTVFMELCSKRRRPMDNEVKNAVCLNMFLTAGVLQVPKKEQGWYTAHEVLQMVPLWERSHMYTTYLHANRWARKWFRVRYEFQKQLQIPAYTSSNKHIKWYQLLEQPLKHAQLWFMRKRRTTEVISDVVIRFHPKDARIWIRESFLTTLRLRKVPLDKKYNQI